MSMLKSSYKKIIARNRRARFDYNFSDYFTAGILLKGYEVKAAKAGQVALSDSFVRIEHGEVWLINAYISKWKFANVPGYDPKARRKLLLNKREINKLQIAQDAKKMSIIPIEMLISGRRLKLKIGVGKGRKKFDKRRKIKEKEMKREIKEEVARMRKF